MRKIIKGSLGVPEMGLLKKNFQKTPILGNHDIMNVISAFLGDFTQLNKNDLLIPLPKKSRSFCFSKIVIRLLKQIVLT